MPNWFQSKSFEGFETDIAPDLDWIRNYCSCELLLIKGIQFGLTNVTHLVYTYRCKGGNEQQKIEWVPNTHVDYIILCTLIVAVPQSTWKSTSDSRERKKNVQYNEW